MVRLELFGGASIEGPDGPLTGRGVQRRRLALLSLLAVARGRGLSRDKLIALLWPDSDADRARPMLSDSVYRINQAVGGEAVMAAGEVLRLSPERLPSDAWEFDDAIEAGEWERAVGLHHAPFLDGFFLPGCGEYERWADAERERFARARARAIEELAVAAEAAGRATEAVRWWRTLAADDPYSSRVALRLMRALESGGERAAAVQHARVHALLVREEMGVEPDPEVEALAERLRLPEPEAAPAGPVHAAAAAAADADGAGDATGAVTEPGSGPDTGGVADAPPSRAGAGEDSPAPSSAAGTPAPPPEGGQRAVKRRGVRIAGVLAAAVVAVALVLAVRDGRQAGAAEAGGPTSIAVLPFADLSERGDQEYFADGVAEELMVRLARVDGLAVVGRTSAFAFKGRPVDTREVADRLGVRVVLGGSVRKAGSRLRITVQLMDAASGFELWSDTFEREEADVFAIQDEIARAVVTRLRGRLAGGAAAGAAAGGAPAEPEDSEAYDLYLRGRFEWHRRTEQSLRSAAEFFRQAVARAPGYARAHAGLGDAYAVLGFYDYLPPAEAFPAANAAARRAIEIDPALAEPHATLGYVALYYEWDFARAESEFRRTTDLDPSYSTGHQWYANLLTAMGRFDEATRAMRTAQELDPLSLIANAALGWVLYYAGDYQAAVDQLTRTLELNPEFELAYLWRGSALEQLGRTGDAVEDLRRAVGMSGSAIARAALARAHALDGSPESTRALLRALEREGDASYAPAYEIARVHAALGDDGAAIRWLERAFRQRSHSMVFLAVDPQLERLRGHPGLRRLARDVGLEAGTGGTR